jgi:hypothetical protein
MVNIRTATIEDLINIQQCNLQCLPENYSLRYGASLNPETASLTTTDYAAVFFACVV